MSNIPSREHLDQFFAAAVGRASDKRGKYAAMHRASMRLHSFPFLVYSAIARKADFHSRLSNIQYLQWAWRRIRTHRHVNRVLGELSSPGALLVKHDRLTYSLRGRREKAVAARIKPIRFHVVALAQDEPSALLVRFLLFLAFSRPAWSWLRVGSIQKGLGIDRTVAAALLAWLRGPGRRYTRRQTRLAVFWSRAVRLRHYRPDRSDPRGVHAQTRAPEIARSENVHPPSLSCAFALEELVKRVTGSGGSPPPEAVGPPWAPTDTRRQATSRPTRTWHGPGRTTATRQRGDTPRTPRPTGRMEMANVDRHPPRVTADQLVAWLPESVREKFAAKMRFV